MLKQVIEAQGVEVGEAPFRKYPELIGKIKTWPAGAVIVLTHVGGSGQATFRNKWWGPVKINGQTVRGDGTLTLTFEKGDNATVVYTADDLSTFQEWRQNNCLVSRNTKSDVEFELVYADIDAMLTDDGEIGDFAFYRFYADGTNLSCINTLTSASMDFTNVKRAGRYFWFGSFVKSNIQKIPDNFFVFPKLEEIQGDSVFGSMFSLSDLREIGKNNFIFPNLTTITESTSGFFYGAFQASKLLEKIGEGSFKFPQLATMNNQNNFHYCFANCAKLTELPVGSFNWGSTLIKAGGNFLAYFSFGSGLTVPGNSLVQIYTPISVSKFDGTKNYSAGSTIYVNGVES